MGKRGQFTILVVLGFLILVVIGMVFLIRSSVSEQISERSTDEVLSDFLRRNSVRSYVEGCLQEVSERAIFLAGYQGGNIWDSQGGPVPFNDAAYGVDHLKTDLGPLGEYDISYVLQDIPNSIVHCGNLSDNQFPPNYPYPNNSVEILDDYNFFWGLCSDSIAYDSGFYGQRQIRDLCQEHGPNSGGSLDRIEVYDICVTNGMNRVLPVQYQLKKYAQNKLPECVDFSNLETEKGFQVEILNEPFVEFVFGKADITVNASYPVKITMEGRPPVSMNTEFYYRIDARFKELYEFMWDILIYEARDSKFFPENDYRISNQWEPGFNVTYERNKCGILCSGKAKFDDLITVTDMNGNIGGEPLSVKGFIKNRAPILDPVLVKKVDIPDIEKYVDIVVVNGTPLVFKIQVTDPEGDPHMVTLRNWSVNYNEDCGLAARFGPTGVVNKNSIDTMGVCSKNYGWNRWQINPGGERNLLFLNGVFTNLDWGLHSMRIEVTDGGALDYQDVRILVVNSEVADSRGWAYCRNTDDTDCSFATS